ncbi:hypothetical protein HPP92_023975 [Vanilla planifolia]|uniref:hAT-like transposase RNase-H fold domain-containing protein n=1 Tax=Vanilla planifolia TaxID=51239 RepID=A0A835UC51_VANPL|nr:hypothetical protein HPP92_023975 [Vanilla planifolia]
MSIVCPESVNVSIRDIKRDIISSYLKERDNIKELLGKATGKVCLACENWCSEYSKDEYLCITAHFSDDDWKVHKKIVCLKTLIPPFDGSLIAEEIAICLKQWKIVSKIFSITSDNASYDDGMVSSLKRCFLSKKNLSIDATFFQVQCCCQILNHIVQASLDLADDVIDKIRGGVKYIRKLIWRKKKFYEIAAKEFQLDTKRRLQLDLCYCWNTTYMMLESAFYYKGMLQYWGEHDVCFRCHMLSEEEWEKLSLLQKFLSVFYDVVYMFSVTQHPTSNLYFRALWKVHMHLLKAARGSYSFMTSMVRDMQERFEKYWMNHNLILSCAAVLDPRYKVKLIEFCYTKVCGDKADVLVNHTVRTLYVLFDEYKLNSMAKLLMLQDFCCSCSCGAWKCRW